MNLVYEVRRIRYARDTAAPADVIHPSIDLLVGFESKEKTLALRLKLDTVRFSVHALDVINIQEIQGLKGIDRVLRVRGCQIKLNSLRICVG